MVDPPIPLTIVVSTTEFEYVQTLTVLSHSEVIAKYPYRFINDATERQREIQACADWTLAKINWVQKVINDLFTQAEEKPAVQFLTLTGDLVETDPAFVDYLGPTFTFDWREWSSVAVIEESPGAPTRVLQIKIDKLSYPAEETYGFHIATESGVQLVDWDLTPVFTRADADLAMQYLYRWLAAMAHRYIQEALRVDAVLLGREPKLLNIQIVNQDNTIIHPLVEGDLVLVDPIWLRLWRGNPPRHGPHE